MTNEENTPTHLSGFDIEPETAKSLTFQAIDAWDSVGHMGLVAQIEEAFDIMLEPDDIVDLNSYEKGKEILAKYNVEFA